MRGEHATPTPRNPGRRPRIPSAFSAFALGDLTWPTKRVATDDIVTASGAPERRHTSDACRLSSAGPRRTLLSRLDALGALGAHLPLAVICNAVDRAAHHRTSDPRRLRGPGPVTGPLEEPPVSAAGGVEPPPARTVHLAVVVTPLPIDPDRPFDLSLPRAAAPRRSPEGDGPMTRRPREVRRCRLPSVRSGDPDVGWGWAGPVPFPAGGRRRGAAPAPSRAACNPPRIRSEPRALRMDRVFMSSSTLHARARVRLRTRGSIVISGVSPSGPRVGSRRLARASRLLMASGEQGACHEKLSDRRAECAVTARESSENADVTNARLSFARRPDVHSARATLSPPWDCDFAWSYSSSCRWCWSSRSSHSSSSANSANSGDRSSICA